MEFEIIEAYELRFTDINPPRGWSIHVYFPDWGIDLRGLILTKLASGWHLRMPYLFNYDLEQKKKVSYPVISFLEHEKNKELVYEIREKSIKFVEEKIAQEMIEKEKKKRRE